MSVDRFANAVEHERHYFSNGTEGSIWMAQYCNRCNNDHPFHSEYEGEGCELVLAMMMGWDCAELEEVVDERVPLGKRLHCLAFAPCPCDPGYEGDPGPPKPRPQCPGQMQFFDATETPVGIIWRTAPAKFMGERTPELIDG